MKQGNRKSHCGCEQADCESDGFHLAGDCSGQQVIETVWGSKVCDRCAEAMPCFMFAKLSIQDAIEQVLTELRAA